MATVIGVFDGELDITKASDAIDKMGLGNDVVEVIDHDAPATDTGSAVAPVLSASGWRGGEHQRLTQRIGKR